MQRPTLKGAAMSVEATAAVQAIAAGNASESQQKFAIDFIIRELCQSFDDAFLDNDRDTTFLLGKQHVGKTLIFMTNFKLGMIKNE